MRATRCSFRQKKRCVVYAGRPRRRATDADRQRLFELLNYLEELMATEEERRGEGPFMSEMAKLQRAFLQELATELDES
jgi:hypothetical protein